jgi:hypothetical protein
VTFPVKGITTTRPGSVVEAEAATSEPSGRGSDRFLAGCGRTKAKVSGDDAVDVYCHTSASVAVKAKANSMSGKNEARRRSRDD